MCLQQICYFLLNLIMCYGDVNVELIVSYIVYNLISSLVSTKIQFFLKPARHAGNLPATAVSVAHDNRNVFSDFVRRRSMFLDSNSSKF